MNTQVKNLSDEALVNLYRNKRTPEALGVLFDRYATLVYGVCLKYFKDADQAKEHTSQVFEKLITDLPKYDVQIFKAWLYRVAQNQCLMTLRSNKHLIKSVEEFPDHTMEYDDTMHPKQEKEILFEKLELALTELSDDQRKCIEMFYLQKKTYNEIMTETGFNFMQVKSFIQNGKRNLKLKMTEI